MLGEQRRAAPQKWQMEGLSECHGTGLHGPEALSGIMELPSLKNLWLHGCIGLTQDDVGALWENLGRQKG